MQDERGYVCVGSIATPALCYGTRGNMSLRNDLRGELVAHQCPASDDELVLLLSWLQQQDVDTLGDLRCAGDPSNLEGSHLDIDLQNSV